MGVEVKLGVVMLLLLLLLVLVLLPPHGVPGIDLFFFSARFSRGRSVVRDCFTGQSPGKAISIPAAPDVQRSQAKSKPELLRGGRGEPRA